MMETFFFWRLLHKLDRNIIDIIELTEKNWANLAKIGQMIEKKIKKKKQVRSLFFNAMNNSMFVF